MVFFRDQGRALRSLGLGPVLEHVFIHIHQLPQDSLLLMNINGSIANTCIKWITSDVTTIGTIKNKNAAHKAN